MSLENIKEGRVHVFIVHIDFYFYLDKAQSTCQKIIKGCCQDICISFLQMSVITICHLQLKVINGIHEMFVIKYTIWFYFWEQT